MALARRAMPLFSVDQQAEARELMGVLTRASKTTRGGACATRNSGATSETLEEFTRRAAEAFEGDMQPVCNAIVAALQADDTAALQGLRAMLPHLLSEVNDSPALADLLAHQLGKAFMDSFNGESDRRSQSAATANARRRGSFDPSEARDGFGRWIEMPGAERLPLNTIERAIIGDKIARMQGKKEMTEAMMRKHGVAPDSDLSWPDVPKAMREEWVKSHGWDAGLIAPKSLDVLIGEQQKMLAGNDAVDFLGRTEFQWTHHLPNWLPLTPGERKRWDAAGPEDEAVRDELRKRALDRMSARRVELGKLGAIKLDDSQEDAE